jgi:hypothetical protein
MHARPKLAIPFCFRWQDKEASDVEINYALWLPSRRANRFTYWGLRWSPFLIGIHISVVVRARSFSSGGGLFVAPDATVAARVRISSFGLTKVRRLDARQGALTREGVESRNPQ